ncbi:DUF2509 family protein [Citrobacter sp. RHB25-C09]|uniref:DUF2509 family protein n=1 Tax=Citrobacter sp. RHB25-C09 TaxID=2742624 RepID=UPI0015EFD149|nr:DUF2509 family protein [Citrobacter sp. RHB25-C09]QMI06432.1 DUF2509 family protein [Citrobacter sp. RHB25-C09]
MNREQGVSSLALVLLMLVLGSLLLEGLSQQDVSLASRVSLESQALRRQAVVHSAAEWGRVQRWEGVSDVQCRQYSTENVPVCLRRFSDNHLLLISSHDGASVWRLGERINGRVVFDPHGWSDFCPLQEVMLCQLP